MAARTRGFAAVKAGVASYWPDRVERITGVPVQAMIDTVHALAEAESAMILTARGAEQHSSGTDTAQAFVNLALALGLPGRPFSGYGTITGQGNGQGGREHGQKADQLPGYRKLADPADRAHVAGVWGIDPAELPKPGVSAYELLDRMGTDGGVRVLLLMASNLVVSAPDVNRVRRRLAALDLLVVSDIFVSETAELADVVLPTAQWAEEEGTMTNLEGRVIRRNRALPPPVGVLDDLQVMKALADRLGRGGYVSADPAEVFAELRRASAGGIADYSGITWERIEAEDGVFWPCPSIDHPGTPRLFADTFPTADGRAAFLRVEYSAPAETPDATYPYVLTTGRLMAQYQSGTQTRRVPSPAQSSLQPEAQVHPDLARAIGLENADIVELSSRRGTATFRTRISEDIRPDTVFVPFHWGGVSAANALTNPVLDRALPDARLQGLRGEPGPARQPRRRPPAVQTTPRPRTRPRSTHQTDPQPAASPHPSEGPRHDLPQPFPARDLPVRRRRARQAHADQRRAEPGRAGRRDQPGPLLPGRQLMR